jgi:hypothetical protein
MQSKLELKDVMIVVPALATAMAVTFDVGFFYGLGLRLFTLFSLSEHITFSIVAMPLALIAGLAVVSLACLSPIKECFLSRQFNQHHPWEMHIRVV